MRGMPLAVLGLLGLFALPAFAQDQQKVSVGEFVEQRLAEMDALVERMVATEDPAERAELLEEHRKKMQENRTLVRGMLNAEAASRGPGMMRGPGRGRAMGGHPPRMGPAGYPPGMRGGYPMGGPGMMHRGYQRQPGGGAGAGPLREQRMAQMRAHREAMETRLANIERLLEELLAAQRGNGG